MASIVYVPILIHLLVVGAVAGVIAAPVIPVYTGSHPPVGVFFRTATRGFSLERARPLVQVLVARGWSVFWNEHLTLGEPFHALIIRDTSRFSRRDGDEAFGELKAIDRTGVDIWFYQDGQRFTHGTFGDNVAGVVKAEAAADDRRQIAVWTRAAMEQKARKGYVTGGRCFGDTNVRVNGHVERRKLKSFRSSTIWLSPLAHYFRTCARNRTPVFCRRRWIRPVRRYKLRYPP